MGSAIYYLGLLQQEIGQRDAHRDPYNPERLVFFAHDGLLHIEYYGLTWADEVLPVFETLCRPEVASQIRSLTFRGPDEGANGTRDWNFRPLLAQDVTFPELKSLFIEPSLLEFHNYTVIGGPDYTDDGQLAEWLLCAPRLERLTAPSAPDARFFQVGPHPLTVLRVEAGYDAQGFILHLSQASRATCFPYLRDLDFGEVRYHPLEDWDAQRTPFEHYEALFRSEMVPGTVTLRNPKLTAEQLVALTELQKTRYAACSLKVIRTSVDYVR